MSLSIGPASQYDAYASTQSRYGAASSAMPKAPEASGAAAAADSPAAIAGQSVTAQPEAAENPGSPNYTCQTCARRKYVDQSNDPSVSFKTPTSISPSASAAKVMAHEQEHVGNERASAQAEDRRIVSQYVVLYSSVCPECHKAYVSGGKTVTVSAGEKPATGNKLDVTV